jgi:hypothetical protein
MFILSLFTRIFPVRESFCYCFSDTEFLKLITYHKKGKIEINELKSITLGWNVHSRMRIVDGIYHYVSAYYIRIGHLILLGF